MKLRFKTALRLLFFFLLFSFFSLSACFESDATTRRLKTRFRSRFSQKIKRHFSVNRLAAFVHTLISRTKRAFAAAFDPAAIYRIYISRLPLEWCIVCLYVHTYVRASTVSFVLSISYDVAEPRESMYNTLKSRSRCNNFKAHRNVENITTTF